MKLENWKPVVNYEDRYEVSDLGRVRNKRTGKVLHPQPRQHGYLGVPLYGRGGHETRGCKTFSVHRLVAEAFLPNPGNLPEVNHKDENKQNNALENLEWVSHQQNCVVGTVQARRGKTLTNGPRSKRIAQYLLDGELVRVWPSLAEANRNGYGAANISKCAQGHPAYSHAYGFKWRYVE